ncbi:MAG: glycosyltransferase [Anaerolineales bacterium]|nr:glycosyltransferase [Anaerolineales bacterium]
MHIIHTTSALTPEFGGPVRTVPALCFELAKLGNRVTVVHLDFGKKLDQIELPSHPNLEYISLPVKFRVGLRPIWIPGYKSTLLNCSANQDDLIFHDNGIWLPYSRIVLDVARKIGAKVITTTHGMLEPWAMSYGRLRKLAGWHLYQRKRLMENNVLHATSPDEARNLRDLGLTLPITIIPNGTALPGPVDKEIDKKSTKKTLLFLSRIHPKKGLLNLIQAMAQIKPPDWKVVVAGYDEGGYQKVVKTAVKDADLEEYFSFPGPIDDRRKWDLYKAADLFILPSFSENFGLVVAEALAAELPVITTKGTPWKDLVDYNCGWWVEPSVAGIAASLKHAFSLETKQLKMMGKNGRELVEDKYSWPAVAVKLNEVYLWMLGKNIEVPDTIQQDSTVE